MTEYLHINNDRHIDSSVPEIFATKMKYRARLIIETLNQEPSPELQVNESSTALYLPTPKAAPQNYQKVAARYEPRNVFLKIFPRNFR